MSKPTPISGFPEWLPAQRMIEQYVLDRIRRHLRAVRLRAAGDPRGRAAGPAAAQGRDLQGGLRAAPAAGRRGRRRPVTTQLGLHFDLTVPFARYVLENAGKLQFPFRRYQIQKVWRGERPQEGRYREFLQADIDIVDRDTLPSHYEAEMPLVIGDALRGAADPAGDDPGQQPQDLRGLLPGLGLTDPEAALRAVDKLDKIGPAKVADAAGRDRRGERGAGQGVPGAGRDLRPGRLVRRRGARARGERPAARRGPGRAGRGWWRPPPSTRPACCVADLKHRPRPGLLHRHRLRDAAARLRAVRLDLLRRPVRQPGHRRHRPYPGVGISIGVTRLLGLLFGAGALTVSRPVPTCVLVAVPAEEQPAGQRPDRRGAAARAASPTEVSPTRGEVRQADPVRRAARHPVRLVPRCRRSAGRGEGHPLRRAGHGRCGGVDATPGGPQADCRLSLPTGADGRRGPTVA